MFVNSQGITEMFIYVSDMIINNEKYFCELDSVIGDGDHGITMSRGFSAAKQALLASSQETIQTKLENMSKALSTNMGGAIGPIYGMLFMSFANIVENKSELALEDFIQMFSDALETIEITANVQPGQKTLVDSLAPAVNALKASKDKDMAMAFEMAEKMAYEGAQSTADMIAKKGRARFLFEKSKGFQDAGATSMYIFIKAISHYLKEKGE